MDNMDMNALMSALLSSDAIGGMSQATGTSQDEVKSVLASALPARDISARASGLDMATGFPGEKSVPAACVAEAAGTVLHELTRAADLCLKGADGELAADLCENGLLLTGGGALLSGLDMYMNQKTGLKCAAAETPALCAGKGLAKILKDEALSEKLIQSA